MLVIVKKPGVKAEELDISHELESLQAQVDGYIEFVHIKQLHERGIAVIVNDEGKIHGLPVNIAMVNNEYDVVETLVGNVLFTGLKYSSEGPSCSSLSKDQIEFINEFIFDNDLKFTIDSDYGYIIDSVRID